MRYPTRLSLSLALLSWVAGVRSQDCQLKVPQNPLTAQGLATPYELTGCNQLDFANQGAFVEAAILDPATGNIQIYGPLVINAGMVPVGQGQGQGSTDATTTTSAAAAAATAGSFVPPIVPTLPNNAVVGIWFGSNANTLTLTGATGGCVNGLPNSVFGQFAYCNGQAWFNAAKTAVNQGMLNVPAPGTGTNGQACPTTHDFRVVDQDQSDNLVTTYLMLGNNTLAQNTPSNSQANPNAEVLSNASDNALVTQFVDPALGCTVFQNPCPTCPSGQGPSLATNELQAFFYPPAGGPALIPLNDNFVLVNGQQSLQKVNLYRDGTGQPQADNNNASALTYCQQISQGGIFINDNQQLFSNSPSPAPGAATNLFTFLAMRYSASLGPAPGLGCTQLLNIANPVTLTMDGNGVVTAATINTQVLQQILGMGGTTASASSAAATSASAAAAVSTTSAGGSTASASAPASTTAAADTTSSASAVATTAALTSAAASAPSSSSVASATSSAAATSAPATISSTPTGVLLQNTDTTSAISTSSIPPSATPTVTPTCSIPTSAAPTVAPACSVPTSATPTAAQCMTAASSPATVTVTVTATVCPSQSLASATPSASPTTYNEDWDGNGWKNGGWGGNHWKRSTPMARMHRKSRIVSTG